MEFRKGILFIRLKGDLNKDTIKGIIDKDFKYVVLNIDDMYSIDSYSIKYLNKIYKLYENNNNKFITLLILTYAERFVKLSSLWAVSDMQRCSVRYKSKKHAATILLSLNKKR